VADVDGNLLALAGLHLVDVGDRDADAGEDVRGRLADLEARIEDGIFAGDADFALRGHAAAANAHDFFKTRVHRLESLQEVAWAILTADSAEKPRENGKAGNGRFSQYERAGGGRGLSTVSDRPPPLRKPSTELLLDTLQSLLLSPMGETDASRSYASDLVAKATGADKVDVFLFDPKRNSLVAIGSNQPLSARQRRHGLDVLQIANGGRVVHVFTTGKTFITGRLDQDPDELRGIKEILGIKSKVGVPLEIAGQRRGMMMLASLQPDYFTADDVRFAESVVRWIGTIIHRGELTEEIARNAHEAGRRAVAEELVTVLAHDLRNHFAPILNRLQLLRYETESGAPKGLRDSVDALGASMGRLMQMVEEMLDVARIDRGVFHTDARPTEIPPLLDEIARSLGTRERPIDVRVQATRPLVIHGDPARIRQCLENLVSNALQKSPEGATVTVIARNEQRDTQDWCMVEVIDEGPGIPADLLPHIFDRFRSGKVRQGGLGLGLYLARRIAEMHGGEITVESETGKGARFRLYIPCIGESTESADRSKAGSETSRRQLEAR
jgi:signal transduction histidine kinase